MVDIKKLILLLSFVILFNYISPISANAEIGHINNSEVVLPDDATQLVIALIESLYVTLIGSEYPEMLSQKYPLLNTTPYLTEEMIDALSVQDYDTYEQLLGFEVVESSDSSGQFCVKIGTKYTLASTFYNGAQIVLNPLYVSEFDRLGLMDTLTDINESFNSYDVKNYYDLANKINSRDTVTQISTSDALAQSFGIMLQLTNSAFTAEQVGYDNVQMIEFENNPCIQYMRNNYLSEITTGNYFITREANTVYGEVYRVILANSPLYIDSEVGEYCVSAYNYSTIYSLYQNSQGEVVASGYGAYRHNYDDDITDIMFTNCPTVAWKDGLYGELEFPYNETGALVIDGCLDDALNKLVSGVIDRGLDVPKTPVLDMPDEEVKAIAYNPTLDLDKDLPWVLGDKPPKKNDDDDDDDISLFDIFDLLDGMNHSFDDFFDWLDPSDGDGGIADIINGVGNGTSSILQDLKDGFTWLFVPEKADLSNFVHDMNTYVESQTGILTYPFSLVLRLLNTVQNASYNDCVLSFPELKIFGHKMCDQYDFNFSQFLKQQKLQDLYQLYLRLTDVVLVFLVLKLAHSKWNDFINNHQS